MNLKIKRDIPLSCGAKFNGLFYKWMPIGIMLMLFSHFGCHQKPSQKYASANFDLIALADGVYACTHKFGGKAICNVGVVDNGSETIIFDSFLSPEVAEELLDVVERLNLSPIRYVVNSHSHNDHIRGNQVFAKDVQIISTSRTAELIKEWEPLDIAYEKENAPQRLAYYDSLYKAYRGDTTARAYLNILMWRPYYEVLAESHRVIKTRIPDVFVDDQQYLNGPDRSVQIVSKGQGHTESDLIMYLPDDGILFSGDLVFNESHPYMPHGSIDGWKEWLDFLDSLRIEVVIPGHGPVGPKALIQDMQKYIIDLETLATALSINGITGEEIDDVPVPADYKNWWFERFFLPNLNFALENLEEKMPVEP
jgi:glyoxylase-like metal-dependent hydrolase (beta-lactamase superfamily II)